MATASDIVEIAKAELGYREKGNNDTKYGLWYGMNNNPWCMMFVSWCAMKAGVPEDVIPKLAYVPYAVDFFKKRGRYKKRGEYRPKPGDIIFFGSSSHVGLVERVDGNVVTTIEGNTSAIGNNSNGDGVYRRERKLTYYWIMGYGIPEYEEEEDMKRYQTVEEIPSWGQEVIKKLIAKGVLKGNTNGLDISEDQLRILVWNDRAGLYK